MKMEWLLKLLDRLYTLLKWLYKIVGVPFPLLSIGVAAVVGALIFGGGWWLLGQQYRKDHPNTIIDLDNKLVSRIGDPCLQPKQAIDKTNTSNPLIVNAQPVVIRWRKPESRQIAVYKNEQLRFPEIGYSPGQELPDLEPGRYYLKITSPRDYIPLHIEVISNDSRQKKREVMPPTWLKFLMTFYEIAGVQSPCFSIGVATVLGVLIFGGGWWLLGQQYQKDHPEQPPDKNNTRNQKGEESCVDRT